MQKMLNMSATGKNIRGNQSASETAESASRPYLPHIRCKDNARLVPRYAAALQRPADEGLPPDDLDDVQHALETLLSITALRKRMLISELDGMDKGEKRKDSQAGSKDKQPKLPLAPVASTSGSSSNRRRRDDTRRKHAGVTKRKIGVQSRTLRPSPQDTKPRSVMKSDVPNRFWVSVEPYCMPVTKDDLRLIDDLIAEFSDPADLEIPPLGEHYSAQLIKQEAPSLSGELPIKKIEPTPDELVTGPITQRLISSLIELPSESAATAERAMDSAAQPRCASYKMKNGYEIEHRLRRELAALGLPDSDDDEDDEVLNEINNVVAELKCISGQNVKHLSELRARAVHEIQRNEVQRKLDEVDGEISALYQKISEVCQTRGYTTPQEAQEIDRLTTLQQKLVEQLAAFG